MPRVYQRADALDAAVPMGEASAVPAARIPRYAEHIPRNKLRRFRCRGPCECMRWGQVHVSRGRLAEIMGTKHGVELVQCLVCGQFAGPRR